MKNGVSTLVPFMDATKLQPLLDQIAPDVAKRAGERLLRQRRHQGLGGAGQERRATGRRGDRAGHHRRPRSSRPAGRCKVVIKNKEPDLTTEEAKAMGIKDLLSSYTTTYSCPAARQINVKLATKYATDVLLAPGEEYNFDKQIGPRTAARGWQLAPGIVGPNQLEDVLGGGICQVSTTMFNAAGERRPQDHRAAQPLALHLPLSQGPGRDGDRRGQEPALRERHRSLHLDPGLLHRRHDDHHRLRHRRRPQGHVTWTVGDFYGVSSAMTKVTIADPSHAGRQDQGHRQAARRANRSRPPAWSPATARSSTTTSG